jgi:protein gp37
VTWNGQARSFQIKNERRQRVFCASLADVFDNQVDPEWHAYRQRVPHILNAPAAIHFVSYEPAIGPLGQLDIDGLYPDWLIIGGESGVRSDLIRPTDPRWARDAIAECRRLGAAPFLKQWGTYKNNPYVVEAGHSAQQAMKIDPPENGKGGGKLDDRLWREFPISTRKLESMTAARGRSAENGSEGRTLFVG